VGLGRAVRFTIALLFAAAVAVPAIETRSSEDPAAPLGSPGSGPATIRAEGRLLARPGAEVVVSSEVEGRLTRVVPEDTAVRAGDAIAEIESDEARTLVDEASARASEAAASGAYLEIELASMRRATSGVAALTVAKTRAEREAARAREEGARAATRRFEVLLRRTTIRAPLSGVVLFRHAQPGELAHPGSRVATIADLGRTWIEAEVDEFDAARVRTGDPVTVIAEGFPGAAWRARVEEVPEAVVARRVRPEDPGRPTDARVLLVKCALVDRAPLKLGQRVEVLLRRGS
jgi:RND family efflux transporter MFP subunit